MTAEEAIAELVETGWVEQPVSEVVAVIRKAVAAEREACARIAEEKEPLGGQGEIADAIRARGNP